MNVSIPDKPVYCAICGKKINILTEPLDFIKGGICDGSGMVYVHHACYEKELRHDKR